jgi:hypothetical protein
MMKTVSFTPKSRLVTKPRAISCLVSVRERTLLPFVNIMLVYSSDRISLAGELFRFDPAVQKSDLRNNKSVVLKQNPVFNVIFALFFDKVFGKFPGAGGFLIPFGDLTVNAILAQKITPDREDDFLVSASSVAYLETALVRSLFSNGEAASVWTRQNGFYGQRENFHRKKPKFREQMLEILKIWYEKFPAKKSRNRLSGSGPMGGNGEDFLSCEYPDAAADKENISRLHLFDAGEASAAAAVHSSRLTLRLTCR